MLTKSYSLIESLFVLIIICVFSTIFNINIPKLNQKDEIISSIIHTQFISFLTHNRTDFKHNLVDENIWFNMNGNINQANTIHINDSNQTFTIMLFTGRIHE